MPTLIRWTGQRGEAMEDPFTAVADEDFIPRGDVIISLQRFQNEGQRLLAERRKVGVRIEANEQVEDIAADLPNIAVVGGYANQTAASYMQQDIGFVGVVGSYTFFEWGKRRNTVRGGENLVALAKLKVQQTQDEVRQKALKPYV